MAAIGDRFPYHDFFTGGNDLSKNSRLNNARENGAIAKIGGVEAIADQAGEKAFAARDNAIAAFNLAAETADDTALLSMRSRLLEPEARNDADYIERAIILRSQSAAATAKESAQEAIRAQNLILISRGKAPISPAEERRLMDRVLETAKKERAFLDVFIGKMSGVELRSRG